MPADAQTQRGSPRLRPVVHHITVGRYRDRQGDHLVALVRDPDAGGPWQLTDTLRVTDFLPEESAAEAMTTAEMYLREHGGKR